MDLFADLFGYSLGYFAKKKEKEVDIEKKPEEKLRDKEEIAAVLTMATLSAAMLYTDHAYLAIMITASVFVVPIRNVVTDGAHKVYENREAIAATTQAYASQFASSASAQVKKAWQRRNEIWADVKEMGSSAAAVVSEKISSATAPEPEPVAAAPTRKRK